MQPVKVLFVDDDDSLQALAAALMKGHIFTVLGAKNPKIADQILGANPIDVIVCDVMMPEEDGFTFVARLRERGVQTPVLFLSACGDPRSIRQGLSEGAKDYLVKPFDIRELQRRILLIAGRKEIPAAAGKPSADNPGFLGWFHR